MLVDIKSLTEKVLAGGQIEMEQALWLYIHPLSELTGAADMIRRRFCGSKFDLCSIINAKSGRCSENCMFCAQSAYNRTCAAEYSLLPIDKILAQAEKDASQGVHRFSIVTSGKRLTNGEIEKVCSAVRCIKKNVGISVCVSVGLLSEEQFRCLKEAGVSRAHNNLETSRRNFPNVCTTHTFDDKLRAIRAAKSAGLSVCSGGIMGLGETVKDRIEMAFSLRELCVKSVPVNMLNAIKGTPFEKNQRLTDEDMRRIIAVYRFILPSAFIRLAGGRGLLGDKGKSCFTSGANAAITGDMLTTAGITVETDKEILTDLKYDMKECHE